MNIGKKVAQAFIARAKEQNLRGKARDGAALEFFCGAAAAQEGADNHLIALAWFVSHGGYREVERIAAAEVADKPGDVVEG